MKEHTLQRIKKRSVTGVLATGAAQAASLAGGFVLSIILDPETFGVFTVVVATTVFLGYFSDIGLAAALIQKKEKVTARDLATTFTIQQLLVVILVSLALVFSSSLGTLRGFSYEALILFRALVVSFFLSSLKTIPSVLLERDLEFKKLVIPQIAEIVIFNAVVVGLVWMGHGIWSFTWGILARSVIGLVTIYIIRPWMPTLKLDKKSARQLISFGVPFQINSILALVKDHIFIMILPLLMPLSHVGYIGWAKKWAEVPLRLFMDIIIRVTFPTYSRLQNYPDKLSRGVDKTLFFLLLLILPMSVGMLFLIEPLTHIIPRYEKWTPALTSFYLFVITAAVASVSTPLLNALNAIGKISVSLKFMIVWTIMQWTIGPILMLSIGFDGFAITSVVMSTTTIGVVAIARRSIKFHIAQQARGPLTATAVMAVFMLLAIRFYDFSILHIVLLSASAAGVYVGVLLVGFKQKLVHELGSILRIIRS